MARVITFSTQHPKNHPKEGQPTWFVEKTISSFMHVIPDWKMPETLKEDVHYDRMGIFTLREKHHTIRQGNRFKIGDKFSPRIWSGKPYASPQVILSEDITIRKVWSIEIKSDVVISVHIDGVPLNGSEIVELADNDGLSLSDFNGWFQGKDFTGQIICWNDKIDYSPKAATA